MFHSDVERCMNCGAELPGAVCEACELTPAAASLVLRRKLVLRTGVFMLGSMAFVAAAYRFPPLEMDGMLVFCGIVFFVGLGLAVWLERGAVKRRGSIELRKALFRVLVPVPWFLASFLFVNAKFDNAPLQEWPTRVVRKFSMSAIVPTRRLIVISWREGHTYERVPVSAAELAEFHVGESVVVEVHPGLIGIPWIAQVIKSSTSIHGSEGDPGHSETQRSGGRANSGR